MFFEPDSGENSCFFRLSAACVETVEAHHQYTISSTGRLENFTQQNTPILPPTCADQYQRMFFAVQNGSTSVRLGISFDDAVEFSAAYPFFLWENRWYQQAIFLIEEDPTNSARFRLTSLDSSLVVQDKQPLNTRPRDEDHKSIDGPIVGGVIGGCVLLIIVVVVASNLCSRRRDALATAPPAPAPQLSKPPPPQRFRSATRSKPPARFATHIV